MTEVLFFISILFQSQAGTLVRFAAAESLAICFWRLLLAALLLLPLIFGKHKLRPLHQLSNYDWFQFALAGAFLFAHFYFFFLSIQQTTVANATILFSLNPVTTAIGAYWFFGERVTLHLALACVLGTCGVLVLFGDGLTLHPNDFRGDVWGVLAPLCFSGYVLTGKHVRQKVANSVFAVASYLQCVLYSAIAMMIFKIPFTGYSRQTWGIFALLAIFPTVFGHAIFSYCLNSMNVNFMSCMTLTEPALAGAAAYWLFGEPLSGLAALGFALTGAAVVVLYWDWLAKFILGRKDVS